MVTAGSSAVLAGLCAGAAVLASGSSAQHRLTSLLGKGSGPARPPRGAVRAASATAAIDVPAALAAELRAGRELAGALAAVAAEHDHDSMVGQRLAAAASAAATGGDLRAALLGVPTPDRGLRAMADARMAAQRTDLTAAFAATAACCGAAHRSGLALAGLLESVSASARAAHELEQEADAELAGVRSSVVVLAALPVLGLAMGEALGARPLALLVSTGWGLTCLLTAALLEGAGCWWLRCIARGAVRALR